jgi:hydrogenase nickel incorporation protein HypB
MCDTCGCGQTTDSGTRTLRVQQDVLSRNDELARHNREHFAARGILAVNLVSSPGAGKTTLLEQTLSSLRGHAPTAVIVGDPQTTHDADHMARTGAPAIQINTGQGCHLDAGQVHRACHRLEPEPGTVLFVENVGNLVCPALFDLGEAARVVLVSVTEGDDKPLKYPTMFAGSDLCLITKSDLLPHVDFSEARCREHARAANPGLVCLTLSAKTGQGLSAWYDWLAEQRARLVKSP